MSSTFPVFHNQRAGQFEVLRHGYLAVLEYQLRGDRIIFTHTGVPEPIEGKGIGSALARAGLTYATENRLRVVPACPFVRGYIERHPEYRDLVVPE